MWDFIKNIFRDICSAALDILLFIIGLGLAAISIGGVLMGEYLPACLMALTGTGLCVFGSRKLWLPQWKQRQEQARSLTPLKPAELSETSQGDPVSDFAQESFDKAVADYNSLNDIIRSLSDRALAEQLQKMQAIALKMLNYMKDHPEKVPLADQFIHYYQDRAVTLSKQFLEFEEMNLNTKEIMQLKENTKTTLESFDEAYEAQFSRMVSDKVMEMESELQVARQIMSDAGIKNKPETAAPHDAADSQPASQGSAEDIVRDFRIERPFDANVEGQVSHQRPRGRFQR